jgi:L-asparaginase/Glu-tRNA(Gln) amidotransferase subunit D
VISAGTLSAAKARLLLMLLLARGDDPRAGFADALGTLGCST